MTSYWPRWRIKSPASRLFTQSFIRVQIKENIKAPRHWPLCGEFTGPGEFPAQRASNAENVYIWWRPYGFNTNCLCHSVDLFRRGQADSSRMSLTNAVGTVGLCCSWFCFACDTWKRSLWCWNFVVDILLYIIFSDQMSQKKGRYWQKLNKYIWSGVGLHKLVYSLDPCADKHNNISGLVWTTPDFCLT